MANNSHKFERRKKSISFILSFLFLLGMVLIIFEINIYRDTIIEWTIPTAIWIFSGVLLTPFTSTLLNEYYDTKGIILQLIFNIAAFGGIVCYIFMALNFYFPFDREDVYHVEITNTGRLAKGRRGCGNPYADVKVKGHDKQLVFSCGFDVEKYSNVILIIKPGLLGFDIIMSKKLL